ncbi:ABC transporter substrate-binding protein, partial [Arthrobacter sp. GCM10027362]
MPQPVDVGTLLGGRYKVTARVLASAEQDLVLDGVDEVLNRPVSILVASPDNASQVAMSAREIATGEREGNVQVLDLGNAEGNTYLVTNQAEAADLLDLVIQQDVPYVEPFFTETLGSEIFGQARSTEPQYDEDEEWEEEAYREEDQVPRPTLRERLGHIELPRFGRGQQAGASGAAAAGAGPETDLRDVVP